jgi:hypothetical protein
VVSTPAAAAAAGGDRGQFTWCDKLAPCKLRLYAVAAAAAAAAVGVERRRWQPGHLPPHEGAGVVEQLRVRYVLPSVTYGEWWPLPRRRQGHGNAGLALYCCRLRCSHPACIASACPIQINTHTQHKHTPVH